MTELQKEYLSAMVQAMYRYETTLIAETELLTDREMMDFYFTYMGGKL